VAQMWKGSKQRLSSRSDKNLRRMIGSLLRRGLGSRLPRLDHYALILCYPDAIATNSVVPTISFLKQIDFQVMAVKAVQLTSYQLRHLRLHEQRMPHLEESQLRRKIETGSTSLCLILYWPRKSCKHSASSKLAELKGSTHPALRQPTQLRSVLRVTSPLFKLIHSPDSSGDFVREIALLFGYRNALAILESCLRLHGAVRRLSSTTPYRHALCKCERSASSNTGLSVPGAR